MDSGTLRGLAVMDSRDGSVGVRQGRKISTGGRHKEQCPVRVNYACGISIFIHQLASLAGSGRPQARQLGQKGWDFTEPHLWGFSNGRGRTPP